MKRQVPLVLCFAFGIAMVFTQFSPHTFSQGLYKEVNNWTHIITPFALVLAVATLIQTHWVSDSPPHRLLAIQHCCLCRAYHHGSTWCFYWPENPRV